MAKLPANYTWINKKFGKAMKTREIIEPKG